MILHYLIKLDEKINDRCKTFQYLFKFYILEKWKNIILAKYNIYQIQC